MLLRTRRYTICACERPVVRPGERHLHIALATLLATTCRPGGHRSAGDLNVCGLQLSRAFQVERGVTTAAQNDEVLFAVRPQLASPNYVMDLELIAPAAVLAFPAIPLQDFQLKLAIALGVEPKPRSFSQVATHADGRMSRKNCRWCAAGRNAKDRRSDVNSTSAFPFSRFAPARKSAQIISRQ